jgi:transcriptional regulator with XRE-family HTH domain
MRLRNRELLRAIVGPEPEKKMSARQLACASKVHPSFINHLTAGRSSSCTPQVADRIAQALGLPTQFLFEERLSSGERKLGKRQTVPAA